MSFAIISFSSKSFEEKVPVGMVTMADGRHNLYNNHDKGLVYFEDDKEIVFMDWLDEDNYEKVISEMQKMMFTKIQRTVFQVTF